METTGYYYFFYVCGKYIKYHAMNKKELLKKAIKDVQLRNLLIDYNPIRVQAYLLNYYPANYEGEKSAVIYNGKVIKTTNQELKWLIKQNEK